LRNRARDDWKTAARHYAKELEFSQSQGASMSGVNSSRDNILRPESGKPLFIRSALIPFALVTALFFLWGVPNNLNDILIRQFMKSFALSRLQAGLVQSAFYMGYFLLALPSALYMRRFSYKTGFITGLALFGVGTFLFWPAAEIGRYSFFLFALFVMASGLAFLETASNTFIALSGPPETSERRLNFSQAFNPLGSITGALIGTTFIFSGLELGPRAIETLQAHHAYGDYLHSETLRVVRPYIFLGLVALAFAFAIWRTPFPRTRDAQEAAGHETLRIARLFRNKHLLFTILAQFFYVGAQVGTWSYFIQYIQDYTGQTEKIGGYFLTGTLAMFGIGRFASSVVMKYIRPATLMGIYCLCNIALVSLAVIHPGWTGVWALFATSFFMSLMYPTIFALGLQGLGADSKVGGSLIVMAIIGGAVLTPLMGIISDSSKNIAFAYGVPLTGYVFIACYSFFVQAARRSVAKGVVASGSVAVDSNLL
jgi:FHS family L-fucose permease-like MFS transporter